jgi:hypothetical protein
MCGQTFGFNLLVLILMHLGQLDEKGNLRDLPETDETPGWAPTRGMKK